MWVQLSSFWSVLINTVQMLTVFDVSCVGYDGGFKNPNFDLEVKLISFSTDSVSLYLKKMIESQSITYSITMIE